MDQPRNKKIGLIFEVSYGTQKTHITKVKARVSEGGPLLPLKIYTKTEILKLYDSGFHFMTAIRGGVDYTIGADVDVFTIKGKRFLKTVPNDREEDNLGELPTF